MHHWHGFGAWRGHVTHPTTKAAQALNGIDEVRTELKRWLDALHADKNPFTPEELERLRNERF